MSQHIKRIDAWTCSNAYACVPFFIHTAHAFGVISLEDLVLELWFSNLRVKFAKQEVMLSIFITSLILGSTSHPFDCLWFTLPFPCPLGLWEPAFFNAWSLWQLGLVCPWIPQWWQKCWVWGPLCAFGRDFLLALGLATNGFGGFVKTFWTITFGFFSTIGVATIGSLALTNFISLDILALELLSLVHPKLLLSEEGFWYASTLSSFFEATHSTFALAWMTSSSRNLIRE